MKLPLVFMTLVATTSMIGCEQQSQETIEEVIRPVKTVEVSTKEQFGTRKYPGEAKAANVVTLAFEVSGKLESLPIDIGDLVTKGQVLAKLDERDYLSALEQVQAELERSKAHLQRVKAAIAADAISQQELTNAQAAYKSAQAEHKIRAKALEDTYLKAPYDGIVVAKYIDNFSNVTAKQPAIRLVDPNLVEMTADVPEDIISLVTKDMQITVEFDALSGTELPARVSEIGTEASESTGTYPVTLLLEQPENMTILPGMTGSAWRTQTLATDTSPENMRGFELPVNSILSVEQQDYVWVVSPTDKRVTKVSVESGELTNNGVLVRGLSGGETVVTAGIHALKEGQKVRLLKRGNKS